MFGQNKISSEQPNELKNFQQLAELITAKCGLHNVELRTNNAGVSIVLDDNAFVDGVRQNERAVSYLRTAGANIVTEVDDNFSYLTSSVCTLNQAQCLAAMTLFKALPELNVDESKPVICMG